MNLQNQIDYLHEYESMDMFDGCSVPAGLDMQGIRSAIVMRCGLMFPLFSEPMTQRSATQQFFFENQWNFDHIVKVLEAQYSPIENVAEVREETTKNTGADTLTIAKNSTETHSGTDDRIVQESGTTGTASSSESERGESGQTVTERKISAENISTYSPDNEETIRHGKGEEASESGSETITHGKRTHDATTHGHKIATGGEDVHTSAKDSQSALSVNRHGNIGVTTNQEMINQELDLMIRFNAYRFIADMYEKELMLGIY